MVTIKETVIARRKKKDGTWNLKIRVTHKRKVAYIETPHFVNEKQLKKDLTLKDPFLMTLINPVVDGFRKKISELGEEKIDLLDVYGVVDYLKKKELTAERINIIEFGETQIVELDKLGRKGSRDNMKAVVYGLQDFFGSSDVPITEITSKMLRKYEEHLRKPRIVRRPDQNKVMRERKTRGVSDGGLHNHMRDLRILFNKAIDLYNDKEKGIEIIKHFPFAKYKLVNAPRSTKRKLTIEQVKQIRDVKILTYDEIKLHKKAIIEKPDYEHKNLVYVQMDSREHQAAELAMLSFYMCGMNAVDLYYLPPADEDSINRLEYSRAKTKGRRRDNAFISLHIPDVALPLYVKYAGKLQQRYSSQQGLDAAISRGMRLLGEKLRIPKLWFYDLRHAFGDQARNICGFPTDDVAAALNHKDNTNSVTDIYISKSWAIVDKVQRGVLRLYLEEQKAEGFCQLSVLRIRQTAENPNHRFWCTIH